MGFLSSIKEFLTRTGISITYTALLLYYAYKRNDTPIWAKRIITGMFGYLISPLDAIPDFTPFLGFTDDFSILSYGLVTLAAYINMEVRIQARRTLLSWIGKVDLDQLRVIDEKI